MKLCGFAGAWYRNALYNGFDVDREGYLMIIPVDRSLRARYALYDEDSYNRRVSNLFSEDNSGKKDNNDEEKVFSNDDDDAQRPQNPMVKTRRHAPHHREYMDGRSGNNDGTVEEDIYGEMIREMEEQEKKLREQEERLREYKEKIKKMLETQSGGNVPKPDTGKRPQQQQQQQQNQTQTKPQQTPTEDMPQRDAWDTPQTM